MIQQGELIQPDRAFTACRDPKDDKFLEVAVAGGAEVIVTGDEDLKVLDPFEGIPIISPVKFLRLLRHTGEGPLPSSSESAGI